jgi:hypothetical protein
MRTRGSVGLGIAILYLAVLSTKAESQAAISEAAGPTDPLPTVNFKFETEKTPVALPSLVFAGGVTCGFSDSALLMRMFSEPQYMTQGMYAVSSGKPVRTFSLPAPENPKLERIFRESFGNESGVYMLTNVLGRMKTDLAGTRESMLLDPKNYEILRYDDQGQLKIQSIPGCVFDLYTSARLRMASF